MDYLKRLDWPVIVVGGVSVGLLLNFLLFSQAALAGDSAKVSHLIKDAKKPGRAAFRPLPRAAFVIRIRRL